jgi:hypothetical protein
MAPSEDGQWSMWADRFRLTSGQSKDEGSERSGRPRRYKPLISGAEAIVSSHFLERTIVEPKIREETFMHLGGN